MRCRHTFVNTLEHAAIAQSVLQSFESALLNYMQQLFYASAIFPSTDWDTAGCKLHLIGSLFQVERAGNILISFNNYAARSYSLGAAVHAFAVEFPWKRSASCERYDVRRNLLVKFTNDTIDHPLSPVLRQRFLIW